MHSVPSKYMLAPHAVHVVKLVQEVQSLMHSEKERCIRNKYLNFLMKTYFFGWGFSLINIFIYILFKFCSLWCYGKYFYFNFYTSLWWKCIKLNFCVFFKNIEKNMSLTSACWSIPESATSAGVAGASSGAAQTVVRAI